MSFFGVRGALLWIIVGGIIVRLLLLGFSFTIDEQYPHELSDSHGYLQLAHNLLDGHGFSQDKETPYLPDSMRTPLYPSSVASSLALFGSYVPLLVLQILISGAITLLGYRIAHVVSGSHRLSLIVASLAAFEPYGLFVSTSVITETLFTVILMSGVYIACRCVNAPTWRYIALASALFGVAALVRPIGQFLPALLLLLSALLVPRREYVKYAIASVIPFLIVVGPWLIRNELTFGAFGLTSSGLQNVYSDVGAAVISYRDNVPFGDAKSQLEADYAARHGIDLAHFQQDLSRSPDMFKEGVGIMLHNPLPTIKVFTSITVAFFTNDAWTYYPQFWHMLPRYDSLFSPSYVLMTKGPMVAFWEIVQHAGWTLPIPILGRLFWLLTTGLLFFGTIMMVVRGGEERIHAIFLASLVLYLLVLSATVGFGINGRFRYPVHIPIFTIAVVGGSIALSFLRRARSSNHTS